MSTPDRSDRVIDELAHRYRQGDATALAGLHDSLSMTVDISVSQVIRAGLPPILEPQELRQEVWTILARLALRWRPADARFVACVRASLRWELERVVVVASGERRNWRRRRRERIHLLSLSEPAVLRLVVRTPDHRIRPDWTDRAVDRLLADHVLSVLTPAQARDVSLVALRGLSVAEAARRVGILPHNVSKNLRAARRRVRPFFPELASA